MDSMVRTTMAIYREIDDAWSIWDTSIGDKRKEGKPSSSSENKQKASSSQGFQGQGRGYQSQGQIRTPSQRPVTCYHFH